MSQELNYMEKLMLDDITARENRPHLVGSPNEADSVNFTYQRYKDFFRVYGGARDFLVSSRIKASKARTFAELRAAVAARNKAFASFIERVANKDWMAS